MTNMDMRPPSAAENPERRTRQRFLAQRRGEQCFWVVLAGQRLALVDLSLEGFSMPSVVEATAAGFDFVLQREGVPDEIRGRAEVVNPAPDGQAVGCRFLDLPESEQARLQDWLVAHVIMSATVRITEKDATAIVRGGSLV